VAKTAQRLFDAAAEDSIQSDRLNKVKGMIEGDMWYRYRQSSRRAYYVFCNKLQALSLAVACSAASEAVGIPPLIKKLYEKGHAHTAVLEGLLLKSGAIGGSAWMMGGSKSFFESNVVLKSVVQNAEGLAALFLTPSPVQDEEFEEKMHEDLVMQSFNSEAYFNSEIPFEPGSDFEPWQEDNRLPTGKFDFQETQADSVCPIFKEVAERHIGRPEDVFENWDSKDGNEDLTGGFDYLQQVARATNNIAFSYVDDLLDTEDVADQRGMKLGKDMKATLEMAGQRLADYAKEHPERRSVENFVDAAWNTAEIRKTVEDRLYDKGTDEGFDKYGVSDDRHSWQPGIVKLVKRLIWSLDKQKKLVFNK